MARAQSSNVFYAQLTGKVVAVRDRVRLNTDAELEARHRAEWPELWTAIDEMLERIDW
jgi:hypothetical protein